MASGSFEIRCRTYLCPGCRLFFCVVLSILSRLAVFSPFLFAWLQTVHRRMFILRLLALPLTVPGRNSVRAQKIPVRAARGLSTDSVKKAQSKVQDILAEDALSQKTMTKSTIQFCKSFSMIVLMFHPIRQDYNEIVENIVAGQPGLWCGS